MPNGLGRIFVSGFSNTFVLRTMKLNLKSKELMTQIFADKSVVYLFILAISTGHLNELSAV